MNLFINLCLLTFSVQFRSSFSFLFLEDCEFLDLTHEFSNETRYWGENNTFKLDVVFKGIINPGNYNYEAFKFSGAEHGGTHFDAPIHFSSTGLTNEKVPIKNLIGEACVVDVSSKVQINRDYQMTVADLEEWETRNGKFDERCIVLMRTGWDTKYGNASSYFGSPTPTVPTTYHFPGLSPEAAKWLVDSNRLKAFGIDTPSIDHGPSSDFKTHQILNAKNICGLENLLSLAKLPLRGSTIIALPMKIKDGSGGPLRVIAIGWNGPNDPCLRGSSDKRLLSPLIVIIFSLKLFF